MHPNGHCILRPRIFPDRPGDHLVPGLFETPLPRQWGRLGRSPLPIPIFTLPATLRHICRRYLPDPGAPLCPVMLVPTRSHPHTRGSLQDFNLKVRDSSAVDDRATWLLRAGATLTSLSVPFPSLEPLVPRHSEVGLVLCRERGRLFSASRHVLAGYRHGNVQRQKWHAARG